MSWLLAEAQTRNMEAVVYWLDRDYLDGGVAATCPCSPAASDTCKLSDIFYSIGGDSGESLMRLFGNVALRYYDGSPRPAYTVWHNYLDRRLVPRP